MAKDTKQAFMGLTKEQREEIRSIDSEEDLARFARETGVELPDDALEQIAGGGWFNPGGDYYVPSS